MTKKDFEAIAKIMDFHKQNGSDAGLVADITHDLADFLSTKSRHFDRDKFLFACGEEV